MILILADGNHKIGMGHIYRTINLAKSLKRRKHMVIFLTKDPIAKKIISKTNVCKLYQKSDLKKKMRFLERLKPDIVIIDKQVDVSENLHVLRSTCKTIGIDYRGNNKELLDYGINILYPLTGIKTSFSGFEYAIIDERFLMRKIKMIKKIVNSILILQGGSDTHCYIPKIIKALNYLGENFKITVVLGPSFKCWSKLRTELKHNKKPITILRSVNDMSSIMVKHDLAITAGGNTLLELAYLGIPSIVVCGERFEVETAKLMEKKGFCINLGYGEEIPANKIAHATKTLASSTIVRNKMNRIGKKLVDGKGAERITKIIELLCSRN